jgi:hypothetical protein
MIIEWIVLCLVSFLIIVSYFKAYKLKTRIIFISVLILASLLLLLPIFSFSRFTLMGLFLFERLWILLALVLITEAFVSRSKRIVMIIFSGISIAAYFFLRRFI